MTSFRSVLFALAMASVAPGLASAQLPLPFSLSVEVVPSLAVPLGDFADSENGVGASAGPGISAGASLGFGAFAVYGDYQYTRFGCDKCGGGGLDEQVNDFGWEAGAQIRLPLPLLPVTPWVRGGVLGHQLQFTGNGGSVTSEQAIGFAAGLGADVRLPLPGSLLLAPSVSYRSYSADFDFERFRDQSADVASAVFGLGLVYRF